MAKRVIMIPPFEVLTGNLSGAQDLRYKENNNKAYEAPNGSASARNYVTRYVGAKRADGKSYFAVRRKTTTTLNNKTRMNMAILGSIAAIRSAIQYGAAADWAKLKGIYEYRKEHGGDAAGSDISFNKWIDFWLRQMLQYKQASTTLTSSGLSVTIKSPYASYDTEATEISQSVFAKFVQALSTDSEIIPISVDGKKFVARQMAWNAFKGDINNDNYDNMYTDFSIPSADDAAVSYLGLPLYDSAGVAVKSDDTIVEDEEYTTIPPSA